MSEQSSTRVPLSVLVPVRNEAPNLRDWLASVAFAQEIVVVDSASTDDTRAIAEAAGAQIVNSFGIASSARPLRTNDRGQAA